VTPWPGRGVARLAALVSLLALGILAAGASQVAAQAGGLREVERLAAEGQANRARALLIAWWDGEYDRADREDQQRALWLRARLTVDPAQATRDYQRLVVLYPGGTFTDRALLRLAQAAHAMGDGVQAREHVEALARDYPGSPVRREAEEWLRSAGDPPLARPAEARAQGAAPASGSGSPAGLPFSVQLGAFGEEPRARAILDQAQEAGFEARLVRVEGSPLLHVRVGAFADRQPAQELSDRLARAGLQAAIVRDDRVERPAPR
jgi:hypothetical protein